MARSRESARLRTQCPSFSVSMGVAGARHALARLGQPRKGDSNGTSTIPILHLGVRCVRDRMRPLRGCVPCREPGFTIHGLYQARLGLGRSAASRRARWPEAVHKSKRSDRVAQTFATLPGRLRKTCTRARQGMCADMPAMRSGMLDDGAIGRALPSSSRSHRGNNLPHC